MACHRGAGRGSPGPEWRGIAWRVPSRSGEARQSLRVWVAARPGIAGLGQVRSGLACPGRRGKARRGGAALGQVSLGGARQSRHVVATLFGVRHRPSGQVPSRQSWRGLSRSVEAWSGEVRLGRGSRGLGVEAGQRSACSGAAVLASRGAVWRGPSLHGEARQSGFGSSWQRVPSRVRVRHGSRGWASRGAASRGLSRPGSRGMARSGVATRRKARQVVSWQARHRQSWCGMSWSG